MRWFRSRSALLFIWIPVAAVILYLFAYSVWRKPFTVAHRVKVEHPDGQIQHREDYVGPGKKHRLFYFFLPLIRLDGELHGDESEWAADTYGFLFYDPEIEEIVDWILRR